MPAALVYRYLDAKNRLLGLTLGQAFAVGAVTFLGLTVLSPIGAAGVSGSAYVIIRLALRGRPDGFVRHWTWWTARRVLADGRLSSQARCRTPGFPYAPHIERDVAARRDGDGTFSR